MNNHFSDEDNYDDEDSVEDQNDEDNVMKMRTH